MAFGALAVKRGSGARARVAKSGTVVVPVHQDAAFLELFLKSLGQTIEDDTDVVLVNDGCSPVATALIESWRAQSRATLHVNVLHNDTPKGAGASLNAAVAQANTDMIFVLDSDLILQPGWQQALTAHLNHLERASAVAGMLLYPQTGGINHCGLTVYGDVARHLYLNAHSGDGPHAPVPLQLMGIAFTALRRESWLEAGGMDERYFNGYEDLDLFMRFREAGGRLYAVPEVTAYHWERSNGPHRAAGRKANLARFWTTWGARLADDLWDFLLPKLEAVVAGIPEGRRVGLDLCHERFAARRFWCELQRLTTRPLTHVRDLSHRLGGSDPIWLPVVAGADSDRDPGQYLILTDNFVRLRGNQYWIDQRTKIRDDDIIIDLHGNVVPLETLLHSAWPGEKIR